MGIPWKTSVGKALTIEERVFLRSMASLTVLNFKRPVIVNIGVFRCASMYCLRAGAPSARLVGVDIIRCPTKIHPALRAEFIIEDSKVCCKNFKGPIHLLFVDGDHHYEAVKADIKNWVPKLVHRAFVVFHDYSPLPKDVKKIPHLEGVRRAIDEWSSGCPSWRRLAASGSLAAFQWRNVA